MFRKMILALTVSAALTAWVSAVPGSWGKEPSGDNAGAKAPAAKFNRWLNDFSAAYQQRDGEKMDELLKQFDGAKQDFPAAPRMEKWMTNVKEAYADQDIQKMGRLLDNAQQMRERMRERFGRNQNRQGRDEEGFNPEGRQMRGRDGDFRGRGFGQERDIDTRPYGQNRGQGYGRPDRMGPYAQTPGDDRAFNDRAPRFNSRRPMDSDMRPDNAMPGRFRGQMGRDELRPGMQNRFNRPQFEGGRNADRMAPAGRPYDGSDRPGYNAAPFGRRDFNRQDFGPRMRRQQYGPGNDDMRPDMDRRPQAGEAPGDFWD